MSKNVSYDFRFFIAESDVMIATFQAVEDVEEHRSSAGFTGSRKVVLVKLTIKQMQADNRNIVPSHQAVSEFLCTKLKWHDEKQKPSITVVRYLPNIGNSFLPNRRCMYVREYTETLWERNTPSDEYTTLNAICNKIRTADDLAFIVEY